MKLRRNTKEGLFRFFKHSSRGKKSNGFEKKEGGKYRNMSKRVKENNKGEGK